MHYSAIIIYGNRICILPLFSIQFGGVDPVSLIKKYGGRCKLMHLKDMRKGTVKDFTGATSTENDAVPGTGEIDTRYIKRG